MKNIFRFLRSEVLKGKAWDPDSIGGLKDWDKDFRMATAAAPARKSSRGMPNASLPLATRLAKVTADAKLLDKALPNLNKLRKS